MRGEETSITANKSCMQQERESFGARLTFCMIFFSLYFCFNILTCVFELFCNIGHTYRYSIHNIIPQGEQYAKDFESFKGTPYRQNGNYAADFYENIRFIENYKNIRDLHMAQAEDHSPREEQTHVYTEVERSKQNERKEEKPFNTERVNVPEYNSIPIKLASAKTIERPVQPITIESKYTKSKIGEIKNSDITNSSAVRLQSTQKTSETIKKAVQQSRSRAPINSDIAASLVKTIPETHISTQSAIPSTTIAAASNISSVSSSGFPPVRSGEKETAPKSALVEVDRTTLPVRKESAAMMVAASTSITPDKEMNIKPVLTEPMPMLKATKNKEERTIMVSETTNKSNIVGLKTSTLPKVFLEEIKPISSLIPTNSHQDGQLTLQDDRIVTTENVKPMMDYYFKTSLGSMGMWQPWMDMYNEFAIIWIRFSLNWFDLLWKLFSRSAAADYKSILEENEK